ncbi:hypothetical protein BaRGS_00018514 [Batillaria attramentaria]|uniref:Uncharacterized protein n=1 Tax=Batillaria attramentaria TaxID=370345 RepID=A0ABD0KSH7_9CAEN
MIPRVKTNRIEYLRALAALPCYGTQPSALPTNHTRVLKWCFIASHQEPTAIVRHEDYLLHLVHLPAADGINLTRLSRDPHAAATT